LDERSRFICLRDRDPWIDMTEYRLHSCRRSGRMNNKQAALRTELYNLSSDPSESRDVAAENPEVVAKLENIMRQEHEKSELFSIARLDGARARTE